MRTYLYLFSISILFISLNISSCSVNYSLTGGVIPADAKTVSVGYFSIEGRLASAANPIASNLFTDNLTSLMITQTNLDLVNNNGDLQFSGAIVEYYNRPVAPQADSEASARNRLTMVIEVNYVNTIEPDKSFEGRKFSQFADFDASESLPDIEEVLLEEINDAISQDIFNSTLANW